MGGYVCIHGHFYQPPRENPWLDGVERQASAQPWHDWNERITAECYGPNAAARVLGREGLIEALANNYSRISFDFGPTLLSWLERRQPEVYRAVLEADRQSQRRYGGHGSAMAQAYNHMILPLANRRDVETQVRWGVADFAARFRRPPQGMWLPETAVDVPALEALAAAGIGFTILAPHQAARLRPAGEPNWQAVEGGIDTRRAYRVGLPSGRGLAVFFYDGGLSHAVAFEPILRDGEDLGRRLIEAARHASTQRRGGAALAAIATDGETYGHHHRFGEMALAAALRRIETEPGVALTNYAQFLALHPPEDEVEIAAGTSWSCAHGVERWRGDCGCRLEGHRQQRWRGPLRESLDWLRDTVNPAWEAAAARLLRAPWHARDAYIEVVLDPSGERSDDWLERQGRAGGDRDQRRRCLELLELQRYLMLMYTSCGWFFDELSGPEGVQILQYAARAIDLAESGLGLDLEAEFARRLAAAPSNEADLGDGRAVYFRLARARACSLPALGAQMAGMRACAAADSAGLTAGHRFERRSDGRARIEEIRTGREYTAPAHAALTAPAELRASMGEAVLSLEEFLPDLRSDCLAALLAPAAAGAETALAAWFQVYGDTLAGLHEAGAEAPPAIARVAEEGWQAAWRRAAAAERPDVASMGRLLELARRLAINWKRPPVEEALAGAVARLGAQCLADGADGAALRAWVACARLLPAWAGEVDLTRARECFFRCRAAAAETADWRELAGLLGIADAGRATREPAGRGAGQ